MSLGMSGASRSATLAVFAFLIPLICVGCSSLSGTAESSSTITTSNAAATANAAAEKAINSAGDHMDAALDIKDEINQQLELCDAAHDIEKPARATSYAEAAMVLLPEYDTEQATARELLMSVEATDADEDTKRHAFLLLDWVESRIAESAALSEYIAAVKVVAAAGASLTEAQVNEVYRLDLRLLELHRTADEKVDAANEFSRVRLSGQSSTTVPASDALLVDYDYRLRTVLAWRSAMVTIANLRTYKYNETGPNRKIKPGDLIVEELETLVALADKLPAPPSSLAPLDSAWRKRVTQYLESERALAEKDTQKHREDRAWFIDKELAALNELTAMTATQIALVNTTVAVTTTTGRSTTASELSEPHEGDQRMAVMGPVTQQAEIDDSALGGLRITGETATVTFEDGSTAEVGSLEILKNSLDFADWMLVSMADSTRVLVEFRDGEWVPIALR